MDWFDWCVFKVILTGEGMNVTCELFDENVVLADQLRCLSAVTTA